MPTPTVPTTELEAVNAIIATIGEQPVTTLTDSGLADAALAYTLLGFVSREVQSRGWAFNREYEYPITPDVDGKINVPANALTIRVAKSMKNDYDLVRRGTTMYDRLNKTSVIGKTIKFDMTVALPFTDLPESARWYITVRAARQFLDRSVGNESLHGFSEKDEVMALNVLQDTEGEDEDFNILTNNYSVYRTLDRQAYAGNQLINP